MTEIITDRIDSIKLVDFHTHLFCKNNAALASEEIRLRKEMGIFSCFSSGNPKEWDYFNKALGLNGGEGSFISSFGIHPWYSDSFNPDDYEEIYRRVPAIGEIGMDSVWTDVPLEIQREVFIRQLNIAERLKKPVVLHTKGCEKEIADLIESRRLRTCVHWYSGDTETLKRYIDMGCFFTLGPDFAGEGLSDNDSAAGMILRNVSRDKIFTETDGLESIYWLREIENENNVTEMPGPSCINSFPDKMELLRSTLLQSTERLADFYSGKKESVVGKMMAAAAQFLKI